MGSACPRRVAPPTPSTPRAAPSRSCRGGSGSSVPPEHPGSNPHEPRFHELSHGESFLKILRTRFDSRGLYCLDEHEATLSFSAQIALVDTMHDLAEPMRHLRHIL